MANKVLPKSTLTPREAAEAQKRVAEGLKTQSDIYIQCRGMLHAWQVLNDFRILAGPSSSAPKLLRRDLECLRGCGVVRHDTFLLKFIKGEPVISAKVNAYYSYPSDYQIPNIPRGVKRQVVVYQEEFRRALARAAGNLEGGHRNEESSD